MIRNMGSLSLHLPCKCKSTIGHISFLLAYSGLVLIFSNTCSSATTQSTTLCPPGSGGNGCENNTLNFTVSPLANESAQGTEGNIRMSSIPPGDNQHLPQNSLFTTSSPLNESENSTEGNSRNSAHPSGRMNSPTTISPPLNKSEKTTEGDFRTSSTLSEETYTPPGASVDGTNNGATRLLDEEGRVVLPGQVPEVSWDNSSRISSTTSPNATQNTSKHTDSTTTEPLRLEPFQEGFESRDSISAIESLGDAYTGVYFLASIAFAIAAYAGFEVTKNVLRRNKAQQDAETAAKIKAAVKANQRAGKSNKAGRKPVDDTLDESTESWTETESTDPVTAED